MVFNLFAVKIISLNDICIIEKGQLSWCFKTHCLLSSPFPPNNTIKDTQYVLPDDLNETVGKLQNLPSLLKHGFFLILTFAKLPFVNHEKAIVDFVQKEDYGVIILAPKWVCIGTIKWTLLICKREHVVFEKGTFALS